MGRIFYGIAIAAMGFQTMYDHDFPYMLIPPGHVWLNDHLIIVYISGALLFLAGLCIAIRKIMIPVSLFLGTVLLLIFCFYFIPYELTVSPNYMHVGDWENAAKELALASGAFVLVRKYTPFGTILFGLTIVSFGIDHFLYAKEAADYIPSWIPGHLFWMYFCGLALLGSGITIILNIKRQLSATLLGAMIFIWVVILHIPKVIAAPTADRGGEITSALLALAYCGIAFAIAAASLQLPVPKRQV